MLKNYQSIVYCPHTYTFTHPSFASVREVEVPDPIAV